MTNFRIGNGIDVHRFATKEDAGAVIILGGVEIPHDHALEAHSDGDVLTHALIDAMLGALALGDIGTHFPDTDPQYKGISSLELLERTVALVVDQGWTTGNADITVIAQSPRIAPFTDRIRDSLAPVLQVDRDCISIKATTSEGLGYTGRGEGIAVFASALMSRV